VSFVAVTIGIGIEKNIDSDTDINSDPENDDAGCAIALYFFRSVIYTVSLTDLISGGEWSI
jgi:hypothetical protein